MPVTPRGIVTPDGVDSYDLIVDLAAMASSTDTAITNSLSAANVFKGTAAQRAAGLAAASVGQLWQDTDGIGMIWKKSGSVWVPAVKHWSGTNAEMTAFTSAPNGFTWFDTTNSRTYARISGAWVNQAIPGAVAMASGSMTTSGTGFTSVSFPAGRFTSVPHVTASVASGAGGMVGCTLRLTGFSTTGFTVSSSVASAPIHWIAVSTN